MLSVDETAQKCKRILDRYYDSQFQGLVLFGKNLNWLFELRGIGDYGVTTHVPQEDAEQAINAAEEFLQAIKRLLT